MPVTLDIVIGFSVVMLVFALSATAVIQAVIAIFQLRGLHLLGGITALLRQIDPRLEEKIARQIAWNVLRHPVIARGTARIGSVVHREELVQILLGFAAGNEPRELPKTALEHLRKLLEDRGIKDPGAVLLDIRTTSMHLEAARPDLPADVRQSVAIVQEAASEFVANVNAWFDSTMDRVKVTFSANVGLLTVVVAVILSFALSIDSFEILNRLSIDSKLRESLVEQGGTMVARGDSARVAPPTNPEFETQFNDLRKLAASRLITLPTTGGAGLGAFLEARARDVRSHLWGILLSSVLIGLGAPFWFNTLKYLTNLRSSLAQKDDEQRNQRATQTDPVTLPISGAGEQGDLPAVG